MTINIEEKVREIIIDQLDVDAEKVIREASFSEDLGADSLDTVELLMTFESEFNLEISDDEAAKINTVGDVIAHIEKLKA